MNSHDTILDMNMLNELRTLATAENPAFLFELYVLFFQNIPTQVDELKTAVRETNFSKIRSVGHAMKSSALTVGAREISSLCAEIERHGVNQTAEGLSDLLSELPDAYERLRCALNDIPDVIGDKTLSRINLG